jgi:hypothetical protein
MNSIKFILSLAFTLNLGISFSQEGGYTLLDIGVKESSILSKKNNLESQTIFKDKLTGALLNSGKVVIDSNSEYIILSDVKVISRNQSNAGMMPISILKFELTINLISKFDKKVFGTVTFDQEQKTNTESEGLKLFLNSLNLEEQKFNTFIKDGLSRVDEYYSQNCAEIINNIRKYESISQLEKALVFCTYVPTNAPCFAEVDTLARAIFTSICYAKDYRLFLSAQNSINQEKYNDAIDSLKKISTNSEFYELAIGSIESVTSFIQSKKTLEAELKNNQKELEIRNIELKIEEKKRVVQEGINITNIELARINTEAEKSINSEQIAAQRDLRAREIDAKLKMQESNKQQKENELKAQVRQEEISLQRKQTEVELAHARRRENFMQAYIMQQSMSQSVNLTIVR